MKKIEILYRDIILYTHSIKRFYSNKRNATQRNATQLNATQLNATQLNATQLNIMAQVRRMAFSSPEMSKIYPDMRATPTNEYDTLVLMEEGNATNFYVNQNTNTKIVGITKIAIEQTTYRSYYNRRQTNKNTPILVDALEFSFDDVFN